MSEVRAEMMGTVLSVTVVPGDRVDAGDVVVVLESMKMEIPVSAEASGTVIEIAVAEGVTVSEGDLLVRLGDAG